MLICRMKRAKEKVAYRESGFPETLGSALADLSKEGAVRGLSSLGYIAQWVDTETMIIIKFIDMIIGLTCIEAI